MDTSTYFKFTDEGFEGAFSELKLINGVTVELKRDGDGMVLKNSSLAPFAVYYYRHGSHFIFTSSFFAMQDYMQAHGLKIEYNRPLVKKYMSKPDVDMIRSCSNIPSITQYAEIRMNGDGSHEVVPAKDGLFSIELDSEQGAATLNAFIKKYRQMVPSLPSFTPTLTGGLDTRTMIGFWRGAENLSGEYYLKAVKPDGNNHVEKGREEIRIAEVILDRLHYSFSRTEDSSDFTLCGILTEGNRFEENLNDKEFYSEYVAHHFSKRDLMYSKNHICPFLDNEYLKLKHPCPNFMRVLLAEILCPDLLDIELYSFSYDPMYHLREKFPELSERAQAYMQKYRAILTA